MEISSVLNAAAVIAELFGQKSKNLREGEVPGRMALCQTFYNGKAITTSIKDYNCSFNYTDCASGESDSIKLDICDPDTRWMNAWFPRKGDTITSTIAVNNWKKAKDDRTLNCGKFIVDDVSFSAPPQSMSIGAVSAPLEDAFHATERTRTWENVTIQHIAQNIASNSKMQLHYEAETITIKKKEQSKETDSSFLNSLCDEYSLSIKIFASKIVIFDREIYKKKPAVGTVRQEDMTDWRWNTTLDGTYTGGILVYTDSKSNKDISYSYGTGPRLLKMNQKVDSQADAERVLKAAVNKANHDMTKISFTTMGNPSLVASQCITITGLGTHGSGKYYLDKVSHDMSSGGYSCTYEAVLVSAMTQEVVMDAIYRLYTAGVITNQAYWKANYKKVQYLDELLVNMATRIKTSIKTHKIKSADDGLTVFMKCGILNRKEYWTAHKGDLPYLPQLIMNAANSILSEVEEQDGSDTSWQDILYQLCGWHS